MGGGGKAGVGIRPAASPAAVGSPPPGQFALPAAGQTGRPCQTVPPRRKVRGLGGVPARSKEKFYSREGNRSSMSQGTEGSLQLGRKQERVCKNVV